MKRGKFRISEGEDEDEELYLVSPAPSTWEPRVLVDTGRIATPSVAGGSTKARPLGR